MPIPVVITTEDGRRPMTVAFLRERLASPHYGEGLSASEAHQWLGLAGDGWDALLRAGFPWPSTKTEAAAWFAARGWTSD
jgi:hypothetical protein